MARIKGVSSARAGPMLWVLVSLRSTPAIAVRRLGSSQRRVTGRLSGRGLPPPHSVAWSFRRGRHGAI